MRQLSRSEDCLSDLALDEWSNGELDEPERQRVQEHVTQCERCSERHQALERERAAFYAAAPSFERHAEQFVPHRKPGGRSRRVVMFGAGLAALAALAVIALSPSEPFGTRSKGGTPSIAYFVKRGERVVPGSAGTTLQPGDLLRFTYSAGREYYLALFNLDARAASVYFPSAPRAARVASGDRVPLDFSVELDSATGVEHVYALFCADSFELEPVRAALFASRKLPVPSGCHVDSLTLRKAAP